MVNVIIYGTDSGKKLTKYFQELFCKTIHLSLKKNITGNTNCMYKDSVFYALDMKGNNNTFTKHTCQNCVLISVGNGEGRTQ